MSTIELQPIGIIRTPYSEAREIPIQGKFKDDVEGYAELDEQFVPGLKDLDGFSHAILIYYFHLSDKENLIGKPFLEDIEHGIFSIRGPHRPNHLGFSVIKINKIENNKLYFFEVDMLDGTPLLDIQPYIKYFDCRENVLSGWAEKHFAEEKIPDWTILK